MIELHIIMTGKSFSSKDKYSIFDEEQKSFPSIIEAKAYLAERYGKAKRHPMYVDTKDGQPQRIGYVIGFRNADYSHVPIQHWLQQDWVEFRKCESYVLKGGKL